MNQDFRSRVFLPVMLPIALAAGFLLFSFSLSRILLAIPELSATFLALLVAAYVLVVATLVAARPHLPPRILGVGLVIALLGVTGAGAVGASAGIRPVEHEEEAAAADDEETENGPAEDFPPPDALLFVAVDIAYEEAPPTATAGDLTFALDNQGAIVHNVVIEELGDQLVVEAQGGETAVGDVSLDAGSYTYYCSIPGHREAGMEGTLEVQ